MGTAKTSVDPALASSLRTSLMRLARRLRRMRSDDTLTASQISALGTVFRHGPLTLGELAAHEHVQPPSTTRIVAALEEARLVTRTPHPSDGRQVLVALTATGERIVAADRRRRDAWLHQQLTKLSPDEIAALRAAADVLDKLARG